MHIKHTACIQAVWGGQKWASDPVELGSQTVVSAGNETKLLYKSIYHMVLSTEPILQPHTLVPEKH